MSRNMFEGLMRPGAAGAEGMEEIAGRLVPVEVIAAMTNFTHAPYIRRPNPYLPSNMMDDLVLDNRRGVVDPNRVKNFSAHMGRLNNMPTEQANIMNGFQEYNKGLMKIKFRIQNGGMKEEYISVLGYITNNDDDTGGLSEEATFIPTTSWKHEVQMSNRVGLNGLSFTTERIGARTDYMLNDGSHSSTKGLMTMRPCDVMSAAGDVLANNDVMKQAESEGVAKSAETPMFGLGSINHAGVVCSKRSNLNQSKYSGELLDNALRANNKVRFNTSADDGTRVTSDWSSEMSIISTTSSDMINRESRPSMDNFLQAIKNARGSLRGVRGWKIHDLLDIFPEFESAIPDSGFVLLDRNRYETIDFTEIAQVFGTSSVVETVAQELIFNILDLLVAYGISGIFIKGSNYDEMATDDALSNIQLVPADVRSLTDNDVEAVMKGVNLCEDLKQQIFTRLNGTAIGGMVPVRIEMYADLMGDTELRITNPNGDGVADEVHFQFPTFAPNPYSPIHGDNNQLAELSQSVYSNVRSYILDAN